MKYLVTMSSVVFVFALLFIPALWPQVGPIAPIDVGPDSTRPFGFDFTGLKQDGAPGAIVVHVEFEYAPVGSDTMPPRLVKIPFVPVLGMNTVSMKLALAGVPSGIYNMRARWYDTATQPSVFSEPPLLVKNTVVPPAAPTGLTVVGDN